MRYNLGYMTLHAVRGAYNLRLYVIWSWRRVAKCSASGGAGGGLCSRAGLRCGAELFGELKERFRAQACIPHECLKELNGIFGYLPGKPHRCLEKLNAISAGGIRSLNNRSMSFFSPYFYFTNNCSFFSCFFDNTHIDHAPHQISYSMHAC